MNDLLHIISLIKPTESNVTKFHAIQHSLKPNYNEKRQAQRTESQYYEVQIGQGSTDMEAAKTLMKSWRVFEIPNGTPYPPSASPEIGQTTVNLIKQFGIWFLFACRITNVIN